MKLDPKAVKDRAQQVLRLLHTEGNVVDVNDIAGLAEDVLALLGEAERLERILHPLQLVTFDAERPRCLTRFSDDPLDPAFWHRVELDEHGLVTVAEETISSRSETGRAVAVRSALDFTQVQGRWVHGALAQILGIKMLRVCVAVLVTDEDGHVLLGRRSKEPNAGLWSLPAGGIEHGETWAAAAVREVREETGLEVNIRPGLPPIVVERVEHGVVLIVARAVVGGGLAPVGRSDLLEPRWFETDDLPPEAEISPPSLEVLERLDVVRRPRAPFTMGEALATGDVDEVARFVSKSGSTGEITYITSRLGVQGGAPCIAGTRIQVSVLVSCRRGGWDDAMILSQYPTLQQAHLNAAWAYERMYPDQFIERETEEEG